MMPTAPYTMVRGSIGHWRRPGVRLAADFLNPAKAGPHAEGEAGPHVAVEVFDFALVAGFDAAFTVRLLAGFDPDRRFTVFTGTPIPSCVMPYGSGY
jgi:hypothetical protein